MDTSTISSKYQIVIPRAIRTKLHLRPGQRVQLVSVKPGEVIIKTVPDIAPYLGILHSDEDPVAYQRRVRQDKPYA